MSDAPRTEGRPVGVWRAVLALGDYRLKEALWPEVILGAIIGGGGSALILRGTGLAERSELMGDVLTLAGAFLAVVFTALAIVVALPSTRYLRMLGETENGGMRRFLDPFLVAVGTQIALILLALAYRYGAQPVTATAEHVAFYVIGALFVFGVLDLAGLARQLVRHGVNRASEAATDDREADNAGRVRQLPDRRA